MNQTGVETCRHCPAEVVVRQISTTGDYRPFNRALVAVADVGEPARYVPVQRSGEVTMVLATDLPDARLAAVRWYATRHTCAEGLRAWNDAKEKRRLAAELAGMWGISPGEVLARNAQADKVDALDQADPDRYAGLHAALADAHRRVTGA